MSYPVGRENEDFAHPVTFNARDYTANVKKNQKPLTVAPTAFSQPGPSVLDLGAWLLLLPFL